MRIQRGAKARKRAGSGYIDDGEGEFVLLIYWPSFGKAQSYGQPVQNTRVNTRCSPLPDSQYTHSTHIVWHGVTGPSGKNNNSRCVELPAGSPPPALSPPPADAFLADMAGAGALGPGTPRHGWARWTRSGTRLCCRGRSCRESRTELDVRALVLIVLHGEKRSSGGNGTVWRWWKGGGRGRQSAVSSCRFTGVTAAAPPLLRFPPRPLENHNPLFLFHTVRLTLYSPTCRCDQVPLVQSQLTLPNSLIP